MFTYFIFYFYADVRCAILATACTHPKVQLEYDWTQGFSCTDNCQALANSVGDSVDLVWNSTGWNQPHDIKEFPTKAAYDACDFSAATDMMNGDAATMVGAYTVDFPEAGTRYFSCGVSGHCASNQKLAVTTTAASEDGSGEDGNDDGTSAASTFTSSIAAFIALALVTIW